MDPESRADVGAGGGRTGHLWYKVRQNATRRNRRPKPAIRHPPVTLFVWNDLFDRNREPPDQPCNFVKLLGIVALDGLRQPNETFVVAHRGYVGWNDRGHRPHEIDQDIYHRITSTLESGMAECRRGIRHFGA